MSARGSLEANAGGSSGLNEYHSALIIYYGAVSNWLKRFDIEGNDEERQRLTDEKDKAEQACRNLRADLDKLCAAIRN
jgi:hypothetical protein